MAVEAQDVEGELERQKLQAIDVHLNKDGSIDHVIIYMRHLYASSICHLYASSICAIYMRPIPVAQKFAEAIMQRLRLRVRFSFESIDAPDLRTDAYSCHVSPPRRVISGTNSEDPGFERTTS